MRNGLGTFRVVVLSRSAAAIALCLAIGCGRSGGSDGGGGPPPGPGPTHLTVRVGPGNPGASLAFPLDTDVAIVQVELEAGADDVDIREVRFHAFGSGDDGAHISEARLYGDANEDGQVDPGDNPLGTPAVPSGDDGELVFSGLTEQIAALDRAVWLVAYDIGPGPAQGDVFGARLADETDLTAEVAGSEAQVVVQGDIRGSVTVEVRALSVGPGAANPPPHGVGRCSTGEVVLQVELFVGVQEDVVVDSVTFTGSGTGVEPVDIASVSLYADENGDGVLDGSDTLLGVSQSFTLDNGPVTFSSLGRTIAASGSELWLVVYDLSGSAPLGATYLTMLESNTQVLATGDQSGQAIPVTGAPVVGSPVTTASAEMISAIYKDMNGNRVADAGDVVTLRFNQEVLLQGNPLARALIEVFPTGTFGWFAVLDPGAVPREIDIAVWALADLQPNGFYGVDPTSHGLLLVPWQVDIFDCGGSLVQGNFAPIDLGGEISPGVSGVTFGDTNQNCIVDGGDTVNVTFTVNVTINTSDPAEAFQLPVSGDTFGAGATFGGTGNPADVRTATIVLGTGPVLSPWGDYDSGILDPDESSGLDSTDTPGMIVEALYSAVSATPENPPGVDIAEPWMWISVGDSQGGAQFGQVVSSAGDVNGDGFSDILIGAPSFDTASNFVGKAYLYLGGPSGLSSTPQWTSLGDDVNMAFFGQALAGVGDVNGDGFSDVMVGAPNFGTANLGAGKIYLYLGESGGLPTDPSWTSSGDDKAVAQFGFSLAAAGDVNSDGYSDVIIGAASFDTTQSRAGKAYVYLGGASGLATSPDWTSSGDNRQGSWFGSSVASAGDVDGDGFDDVIVGAPRMASEAGKASIYLGGSSGMSSNRAWSSTGDDQGGARFGFSVASAGDVDGDGKSDVIVGAPGFTTGQSDAGKVYLFLGKQGGPSSNPTWTSSGENRRRAGFGYCVASVGDVDGDGLSDFIVGADRFDTTRTDVGKVYIYLGEAAGSPANPVWTSLGEDADGALFGSATALIGDVNNDGIGDLAVGAGGAQKVFVFCVRP